MYLKRIIDESLMEWKDSAGLKPLLLRGARQVGKSSAVRHLGESFQYYMEVNFERNASLKEVFEGDLDVRAITSKLSVLYGVPIEPGNTLLFLDEIQACPNAIKSLWFFKEDMPGLHVVGAGSLLEFALKDLASFGVGRIRSMFMYPMSFNEFLWAIGKDQWVESKQHSSPENPLFGPLHQELVENFRTFLLVGGMPSSVSAWVRSHDYRQCCDELDDIQQTYYDDFAKYSRKVDPVLLRNTLDSVVQQVGSKFVYSSVQGGFHTDSVKIALTYLEDAGIIKSVLHTSANGLPLGAESNPKFRKFVYLDSGLLLRILDMDLGGSKELTQLILAGTAEDLVNKGSLTEMVAGWELVKYSSHRSVAQLYYWENLANGTLSEVDYIVARDGRVVPIEVKSGTSGKMKSLRLLMKNKGMELGYRCSLENFAVLDSGIRVVPLYCLSNICE